MITIDTKRLAEICSWALRIAKLEEAGPRRDLTLTAARSRGGSAPLTLAVEGNLHRMQVRTRAVVTGKGRVARAGLQAIQAISAQLSGTDTQIDPIRPKGIKLECSGRKLQVDPVESVEARQAAISAIHITRSQVEIQGSVLADLLRRTLPAVCADDSRVYLRQIRLESEEGTLRGITTDGHRLHCAEVPAQIRFRGRLGDVGMDPAFATVLLFILGRVAKCGWDPDGGWVILQYKPGALCCVDKGEAGGRSGGKILVCIGLDDGTEILLESRAVEAGRYPPWRKLIPKKWGTRLELGLEPMRAALALVVKLAKAGNDSTGDHKEAPINIGTARGNLELAPCWEGAPGFKEQVPCTKKGRNSGVEVAGVYLQDFVKAASGKGLALKISEDPLGPVYLEATDLELERERFFGVVMPRRK